MPRAAFAVPATSRELVLPHAVAEGDFVYLRIPLRVRAVDPERGTADVVWPSVWGPGAWTNVGAWLSDLIPLVAHPPPSQPGLKPDQ